jgi:sugar phosphate isomerase/epimerase
MQIGVFIALFQDRSFEEALDQAVGAGVSAVEIPTGGYVGGKHANPRALIDDEAARTAFVEQIARRNLVIDALSCHGNPLHPQPQIAREHHDTFQATVRLASLLGVDTVITFSGCPGDGPDAHYPNWVTCPWPPDFQSILEWQWSEQVMPYWREQAAFSESQGVRVAIEPHPGFVVYNAETLLRLRAECGPAIGANFDPSHFFWQSIDPILAARELRGAIYHVHAKDTRIDIANTARNGVLDTKPYTNVAQRSWVFRTVGYGHDHLFWKDLISELRLAGYDRVLSIEHEDSHMSKTEGLRKAAAFLRECIIDEPPPVAWWT